MEIIAAPASVGQESVDQLKQTIDELRKYEKKNLFINRIRMICSAACLLLLIIAIVLISINVGKIMKQVDAVSETLLKTGETINTVAEDLSKVDFEKLGKSIQNITDIGEEPLTQITTSASELDTLHSSAEEAMNPLQSIHFADLNNGIQKLNEVLEPLAKFFNIFHSYFFEKSKKCVDIFFGM